MWYVYLLKSDKTGRWYTGMTHDLRKRILMHNDNKNKSTQHGVPWKLLYYEACHDQNDAIAREKYLKSGMGKRFLKNRLKSFLARSF